MTVHGVLAVVGSANTDLRLQMEFLPISRQTVLAKSATTSPGGKGANQAVAAAAIGAKTYFIGAVGQDERGEQTRQGLRARGVIVDYVSTVHEPTGQAVVAVDAEGENLIVVAPGAKGALTSPHVSTALSQLRPRVVLCQLETPIRTAEAALQACPGSLRLLNLASAPHDPTEIRTLLENTDVLIPNRSELARLAGCPEPRTPQEADAEVARLDYDGELVVTLGADGSRVYPRGRKDLPGNAVPPAPVAVVDTTGAGDALCGALAVALASSVDTLDATHTAVRFASASTQYAGAQVPEDVLAAMGPERA